MAAFIPPEGTIGWKVMVGEELPTIGDVTLACAGIVAGLVIGTFGYRIFRPVTTWCVGFAWVGGLLYALLRHYAASSVPHFAACLIAVGSGAVAGVFTAICWQVGMVLLGALGATSLGMIILSLKDGGVFGSVSWLAYFFLCILALIGSGAILFLQRYGIIIASALVGAYGFVIGIMVMAAPHTAVVQINRAVLMDRWKDPRVHSGAPTYIAAAFFLLVTVLFIAIQLRWTAYIVSWKHHDPWRHRASKSAARVHQPAYTAIPNMASVNN